MYQDHGGPDILAIAMIAAFNGLVFFLLGLLIGWWLL